MLEITNRRSLPQEFRVGSDTDIGFWPYFPNDPLDLVTSTDRHAGLGQDNGEAVDRSGEFARCDINMGEIGVPVANTRGRANCDEYYIGFADRPGDGSGKFEPPLARV